MTHVAYGVERSCDRPRRVDAEWEGGDGARGVKRGEGSVAGPQEAVTRTYVAVVSGDRSGR
jgi:hypothetical protein